MTFRSRTAALMLALALPGGLAAPAAAHEPTLQLPRPLPPTRFTHGADALRLDRDGVMSLFRDGFWRNWAMDRPHPDHGAPLWLPPPHEHRETVPIPLPPLGEAPGPGHAPRDPSVKLVMECQVVGTPHELPNDIRLTNPYGFATEFGMRVHFTAPLGTEGVVELPSLAPDESAFLLDVLPRGMAPGTACTAVQE